MNTDDLSNPHIHHKYKAFGWNNGIKQLEIQTLLGKLSTRLIGIENNIGLPVSLGTNKIRSTHSVSASEIDGNSWRN